MLPSAVLHRRLTNILPLDEFLFRQRVLHTYRAIMRMAYKHHERKGLVEHARSEFRLNAHESALVTRKYLLQSGILKVNDMANVLGLRIKL